MTYRFDIDFVPTTRVMGASFGQVAKGFRTYRMPLEESVKRVAISGIAENFIVGGRPPWEPLSEETIRRRDREGTLGQEPQDILIETGTLFGDATRLARWTITGGEAYISNLPNRSWYGVLHQTGTSHMPARPWANLTTDDVDAMESIFNKWRDGIIIANWWRRIARLI
jgi:phage gpG-like protein